MKKIILMAMIASLVLAPFPYGGHSVQAAAEAPPLAQPLVREGDLAMSLLGVLGMESAQDEAQAEGMLAAVGIQPQKGWMADYPVTPEIIGQLQESIGSAADSQKLAMGKEKALDAFQGLLGDLGLAVSAETTESYQAGNPPESYPEYIDPGLVDDYYYRVGPPVITYYLPPPAYYPLYSWVYYPFWYSGVFFSGYFILHSFDRVITFRHRHVVVRNYGLFHKGPRFIYPQRRFGAHHKRDFGIRRHSYYEGRSPSARERGLERKGVRVLPRGGANPADRGKISGHGGTSTARPIAPQPHRAGRSESFRHRDFSASGGRSLTRPVVPQHRSGEARSFSRPSWSGRGFFGRPGGRPGRFGGHHGAMGRR